MDDGTGGIMLAQCDIITYFECMEREGKQPLARSEKDAQQIERGFAPQGDAVIQRPQNEESRPLPFGDEGEEQEQEDRGKRLLYHTDPGYMRAFHRRFPERSTGFWGLLSPSNSVGVAWPPLPIEADENEE